MKTIPQLTGQDTFYSNIQYCTNFIINELNNSDLKLVSIRDYDVVGDGITDDTAGIISALNALNGVCGGVLYFPAGTYKITSGITLPSFVSIYGDGPDATILDATTCTAASIGSSGVHIRTDTGVWSSLGTTLAQSGVTAGSQLISFFSAHGLTANDILLIQNPSNYSWAKQRSYYRSGEIQKIAFIPSSSTVRVQGTVNDTYKNTDVDLYKLTKYTSGFIKNLSLKTAKVTNIATDSFRGIRIDSGVNYVLENVKIIGVPYAGIELKQCNNVLVNNCWVQENGIDEFGGDYGLAIYNSSDVTVFGGYYSASRHAITIGGGSETGAVPNRFIKVIGASCHTSGQTLDSLSVGALDCHTNSEHVLFKDCVIDGGIAGLGANYATVQGCHIIGRGSGSSLILGASLKGTNINIHNNVCVSTREPGFNRGAFIDIGSQNDALSDNTSLGGVISIKNNTFDWQYSPTATGRRMRGETASDGAAYSSYKNWLGIINSNSAGVGGGVCGGYTGGDVVVDIQNNTIRCPNDYPQGGANIYVGGTAGSQFNMINFSNNTCINAGGLELDAIWIGANSVVMQNNTIVNSGNLGLKAARVKNLITCKGNQINGTRNGPGILLQGTSVAVGEWDGNCEVVQVSDNLVNNGVLTRDYVNVSNVKASDYLVLNWNNCMFHGNAMGSDTQILIVNNNQNFVLNEKITGSISGMSAYIRAFQGVTQFGIGLSASVGPGFTVSDVITGNISSATATITGITSAHKYGAYITTGNNLWVGRNVWWNSGLTATYVSGGIVNPINFI